jgi:hypothetical protein
MSNLWRRFQAWRLMRRMSAITAGIVVVATVAHGVIDQFFFVSDLIYCFWLCLVLIAVDREPATRL